MKVKLLGYGLVVIIILLALSIYQEELIFDHKLIINNTNKNVDQIKKKMKKKIIVTGCGGGNKPIVTFCMFKRIDYLSNYNIEVEYDILYPEISYSKKQKILVNDSIVLEKIKQIEHDLGNENIQHVIVGSERLSQCKKLLDFSRNLRLNLVNNKDYSYPSPLIRNQFINNKHFSAYYKIVPLRNGRPLIIRVGEEIMDYFFTNSMTYPYDDLILLRGKLPIRNTFTLAFVQARSYPLGKHW